MPSLRQRVSTLFRQLSFIAEPRTERNQENNASFITKYLEGSLQLPQGPEILSSKEAIELPDILLDSYDTGIETIKASYTGPNDGCCKIKRAKLHLSAGPEIDFIDTIESQEDLRQVVASTSFVKQYQRSNSAKSDKNANNNAKGTKSDSRKNSMVNSQLDISDTLNKNSENEINFVQEEDIFSPIPGVSNWKNYSDESYGIAVSLYETNLLTQECIGSPIADCFAIVARSNASVMALADGVNWGENARIAATAAVHGCVEYIDTAIFGKGPSGTATSTREVFISLLRSFWEAHACILEVNGALTTLTCAVVLPLKEKNKYICQSINVGDTFGYVYNKNHGVREFTQGSHDTKSMRNMRDALGALGPVDGNKPELGNLTLSMTECEPGDIVFLASDGVTDNFDPVVGKFAEALTDHNISPQKTQPIDSKLIDKRQKKSSFNISSTKHFTETTSQRPSGSQTNVTSVPVRPPRCKKSQNTVNENKTISTATQETQLRPRPKYLRSQTLIEPRLRTTKSPTSTASAFHRSKIVGLPNVTAEQRFVLTILRFNDLLLHGIDGTSHPCTSAQKLCENLIEFVKTLTTAKRKLLEQHENYYKVVVNDQGYRREIEMSKGQQRAARKRVVDGNTFTQLPGKLDHASVVAWKIPTSQANTQKLSISLNYTETNF